MELYAKKRQEILDNKDIPIITEWANYTPSFVGFGTPSGVSFRWRQNGTDIEIEGKFTSGTQTSTEYQITLPSGLAIASSVISPRLSGQLAWNAARGGQVFFTVATAGDAFLNFGWHRDAAAFEIITSSGAMPVSGTEYYLTFKAPIQGWTATQKLGNI